MTFSSPLYTPLSPPFLSLQCFKGEGLHSRCRRCSDHCSFCYQCPSSSVPEAGFKSPGFCAQWKFLAGKHQMNGCRYNLKRQHCDSCAAILSSSLNKFLLDSEKSSPVIARLIYEEFVSNTGDFDRYDLSRIILHVSSGGFQVSYTLLGLLSTDADFVRAETSRRLRHVQTLRCPPTHLTDASAFCF